MLNDLLGTTMATSRGGSCAASSVTAFGETSDHEVFFTGKPQIGEMGYAFLMRNYRSDTGKWQTSDPLGYPDGWNNFAYCNNEITETIDLFGAKVYWCARDFIMPVGNHHFILFVPDNATDFASQNQNLGNGTQGFTAGGFKDNGLLVTRHNENNDIISAREFYDPNNTSWLTPDFDLEMHEIPTPTGMTDSQFIQALQNEINKYNNNCPYSLVDENCAAWVNTMLERVGIPKELRDSLGDFAGVDWGEEDLIPSQFFSLE